MAPELGVGAGSCTGDTWYRAKQETDDSVGYRLDIEAAWDAAEDPTSWSAETGPDVVLGTQVFYALLTASLLSLTESLTPNLLAGILAERSANSSHGVSRSSVRYRPMNGAPIGSRGCSMPHLGRVRRGADRAGGSGPGRRPCHGGVRGWGPTTRPGLLRCWRSRMAASSRPDRACLICGVAARESLDEHLVSRLLTKVANWHDDALKATHPTLRAVILPAFVRHSLNSGNASPGIRAIPTPGPLT